MVVKSGHYWEYSIRNGKGKISFSLTLSLSNSLSWSITISGLNCGVSTTKRAVWSDGTPKT